VVGSIVGPAVVGVPFAGPSVGAAVVGAAVVGTDADGELDGLGVGLTVVGDDDVG